MTIANTEELPVPHGKYVLDLLRAAGLKLPFGTDAADAELLWQARLGDFDLTVLEDSTNQWINRGGHDAPSLGEFVALTTRNQRERNRRRAELAGAAHPWPEQVCQYCENTGYEQVEVDFPHSAVRPCRNCKPEQRALHSCGCFMPHHYGCDKCRPNRG